MNECKCHYCQEGKQRALLLIFLARFAGFRKGLLQKTSHIDWQDCRLKPSKLLNLIGHMGNKKIVFNIITSIFSEQVFSNTRRLLTYPAHNTRNKLQCIPLSKLTECLSSRSMHQWAESVNKL